jgi:energy-coupling factor transport system permease protein
VCARPEGWAVVTGRRLPRPRIHELVETSPLRQVDPRIKLALSLGASLTVMLPLERLAVFAVLYACLLLWAGLLPAAAGQVWRLKWLLSALFIVDWLVVSLELAAAVSLRLVLLAGAFAIFITTTTPAELRLALEWLRVPYRYAFSVSVAFQSVGLLDDEWRSILEAQKARGAWPAIMGWKSLLRGSRDLLALTVPAVVLTIKRAWAMTEAAYARGFDSPRRVPYCRLHTGRLDWALFCGMAAVVAGLFLGGK